MNELMWMNKGGNEFEWINVNKSLWMNDLNRWINKYDWMNEPMNVIKWMNDWVNEFKLMNVN